MTYAEPAESLYQIPFSILFKKLITKTYLWLCGLGPLLSLMNMLLKHSAVSWKSKVHTVACIRLSIISWNVHIEYSRKCCIELVSPIFLLSAQEVPSACCLWLRLAPDLLSNELRAQSIIHSSLNKIQADQIHSYKHVIRVFERLTISSILLLGFFLKVEVLFGLCLSVITQVWHLSERIHRFGESTINSLWNDSFSNGIWSIQFDNICSYDIFHWLNCVSEAFKCSDIKYIWLLIRHHFQSI